MEIAKIITNLKIEEYFDKLYVRQILKFERMKTSQQKFKKIIKYPNILIIHFNRVIYDRFGNSHKISKYINYPLKMTISKFNKKIIMKNMI